MSKSVKKLLLPNLPYAIIGGTVGHLSANVTWIPWHPLMIGVLSAVLFRGIVWFKGKMLRSTVKIENMALLGGELKRTSSPTSTPSPKTILFSQKQKALP